MSRPKSVRRRALREAATGVYREAILAAAERVFARSGFASAKMADIAREAGMAAGTLYNYFDAKEELTRSLLELRASEFLAHLGKVAKAQPAGIPRLSACIRAGLEWIDEHRGMFTTMIEVGHEHSDREHEQFVRFYERLVSESIATFGLRPDIPVSDQVAFLFGLMKGFVRHRLMTAPKKKLADASSMLVDVLVNGLGLRS